MTVFLLCRDLYDRDSWIFTIIPADQTLLSLNFTEEQFCIFL
ncbi:Uncharacterized protein dnm_000240 [Desulfonema magnum]|uniref:Uncharacterized protein n=1 Tax=Desulfonema magnum TaxID=45655 RepID=A0A975BEQ6_9BACT|nr:Uncharacterized protein dnm_000240 [Desulfonema magnum]